ncbi:unnamed protein product [Closterium sp. Yama58-4]|nr:unnamed protein product [Closterium sp. Yama58-4]
MVIRKYLVENLHEPRSSVQTRVAKWIAGQVRLACKSLLIPTALLNACATIIKPSTKRTRHATMRVLPLARNVAPMLPALRIAITIPSPLVRTAVQLSGRGIRDQLTFATSVPAEQASGTTVCASSDLSYSIGGAQITVVWDAPKLRSSDSLRHEAVGNGMCKSVTFYSGRGCTGQPGLTIARPAKKGRSYPATKRPVNPTYSPQSVGCNLTTCHMDCGAAHQEDLPRPIPCTQVQACVHCWCPVHVRGRKVSVRVSRLRKSKRTGAGAEVTNGQP